MRATRLAILIGIVLGAAPAAAEEVPGVDYPPNLDDRITPKH